ncbi:MAG TPA: hypothetical protein VFX27_05340 [Sphingobium sp.]|nr:hypothetical protein [Sphingobium sp.]
MIALLLFLLAASQTSGTSEVPPTLSAEKRKAVLHALGIRDADIERAQRAMGYVHCLYGTNEPRRIVGLPDAKAERPSFLEKRREECAGARAESAHALIEQMSIDPSLNDSERASKAKHFLDGFDQKFEENVLRPEVAAARRKALQKCIDTKGAANCFK